MENASKALIMAAGVLIGVLILSLAVYLFTQFGSTSAQIHAQKAERQVVQFNSQFTSYLDKNDLTIYDVITVAGYAIENNKYYRDSNSYDNDYSVKVLFYNEDLAKVDENYSVTLSEQRKQNLINYDMKRMLAGTLPLYKCLSGNVEYRSNGRIHSIRFTN